MPASRFDSLVVVTSATRCDVANARHAGVVQKIQVLHQFEEITLRLNVINQQQHWGFWREAFDELLQSIALEAALRSHDRPALSPCLPPKLQSQPAFPNPAFSTNHRPRDGLVLQPSKKAFLIQNGDIVRRRRNVKMFSYTIVRQCATVQVSAERADIERFINGD